MEFIDCPCSGKTLAKLVQPAVMAVLAEESMHGYRIVQRLQAMAMFKGSTPDTTGIYRLLRTMEEKELVASAWDLSETGPAKRRYALTSKGRECLSQWVDTLQTYGNAIKELLRATRKAVEN